MSEESKELAELRRRALRERSVLRDATARLDDLPAREAEVGVVAEDGDLGVEGSVSTPVGKSWSIAAAGRYLLDAGWTVAGKLRWKGGKR